jgi:hypothetical protein
MHNRRFVRIRRKSGSGGTCLAEAGLPKVLSLTETAG